MKKFLFIFIFTAVSSFAQLSYQEHIVTENTPQSLLHPNQIIPVDINGDGRIDILGTSYYDHKIFWYENMDNNGTFGTVNIINHQFTNPNIIPIDYDHDNDMDFVGYSNERGLIFWCENTDGLGHFVSHILISDTHLSNIDGGHRPEMKVADIDNDNDYDFVVASSNNISIFRHDGSNNFTEEILGGNSLFGTKLQVTDIDNDNDIDIIIADSNDVKLFENADGLGNYTAPQLIISSYYNIGTIKIIDLNKDGIKEIMLLLTYGSYSYNPAAMFLINNGSFPWDASYTLNNNGDENFNSVLDDMEVDDIDNDGTNELFGTKYQGIVFTNTGPFQYQQTSYVNMNNLTKFEFTDIDNDNDDDIIGFNKDNHIVIFKNDGSGNFSLNQELQTTAYFAFSSRVDDFNNDGKTDFVSLFYPNKFSLFKQQTPDQFDEHEITGLDMSHLRSFGRATITSGDLNNDDYNDIIISKYFHGSGNSTNTTVMLNDHANNFGVNNSIFNQFQADGVVTSAIENITGGNYNDIVTLYHDNIDILKTNDGYHYSTVYSYQRPFGNIVKVADMNGDGSKDIIVASANNDLSHDKGFYIIENFGNSNFVFSYLFRILNNNIFGFDVKDIDNDGDQDVVVATNSTSEGYLIKIFKNNGDMTFAEASINYNLTNSLPHLILEDINNDDYFDIIATDGTQIIYALNDNFGNFLPVQSLPYNYNYLTSIQVLDINGDGINDITGCSKNEGKIFWLENQDPIMTLTSNNIDEGETLDINIKLNQAVANDTDIYVDLIDQTAVNGTDYIFASQNITIPAGSTQAVISIPISNDNIYETDETFKVKLINLSGTTINQSVSKVQTIHNTTPPPSLSINDVQTLEGGNIQFNISVSGNTTQSIILNATTEDITTNQTDYSPVNRQIVITPSQTSANITVHTFDDDIYESDETLKLTCSVTSNNVANNMIEAIGTITDNDNPPSIQAVNSSTDEGNNLPFTVNLSNPSAYDITLDVSTSDLTATAGLDYESLSQTFTIPAGNTSISIPVTTLTDNLTEPDETLQLNIMVTNSNTSNINITAVGTIHDTSPNAIEALSKDLLIYFPNPVYDKLYFKGLKIKKIIIYNIDGKQINTYTQTPISLLNYKKGIYLLKIITNENKFININIEKK